MSLILSALYVPGDRQSRFAAALTSGADIVVVDLEDAVLPGRKDAAREAAVTLLGSDPAVPVHVSVNAGSSPWQDGDLLALAGAPGLGDVRVAKVESAAELDAVAERLPGVRLHALIESALGVQAMEDIARHPRLATLGLGEADLHSDLGLRGEEALAWVRSRLVVACRAAGLPPPMLSVYPDVHDTAGLVGSCRRGRDLGFVGRSVIHPNQIAAVVDGFRPTAAEVDHAAQIGAAVGHGTGGVTVLHGQMVDPAMVGAAQRVLDLESACEV